MRFLQGTALGVAIGSVFAATADVYRPYAVVLGVVAVVLVVVLASRDVARPARRARPRPATPAASGPRAPTGFFVGRRLG